jgi:hypothetical protein
MVVPGWYFAMLHCDIKNQIYINFFSNNFHFVRNQRLCQVTQKEKPLYLMWVMYLWKEHFINFQTRPSELCRLFGTKGLIFCSGGIMPKKRQSFMIFALLLQKTAWHRRLKICRNIFYQSTSWYTFIENWEGWVVDCDDLAWNFSYCSIQINKKTRIRYAVVYLSRSVICPGWAHVKSVSYWR